MKKLLFLLSFLWLLTDYGQEIVKIKLNVAVLGKKHETIRYYHPINGSYEIQPKTIAFRESILKKLHRFVFIQPAESLKDSINYIQANSLRYYLDPSELIYVDWKMGTDTSNYLRLDSFANFSQSLRDKKYQNVVQTYFNPFFISKYEITNLEYRQFVNYVQDSIFREAIYASNSLTNEQAVLFLSIPKGTAYDVKNRAQNRELFPFNYDFEYRKEIKDEVIIPILSPFYLRQNLRYYKSRQLDTKYLNYRYSATSTDSQAQKTESRFMIEQKINIFPDTLCWIKLDAYDPSLDAKSNSYFWHPAYDHYPVVGINWFQAKAYLHWKQKKLERELPEIAALFKYDLPNTVEYEWAISNATNGNLQDVIQDQQQVTDLIINKRSIYHQLISYTLNDATTEKVFLPYDINDLKMHKKQLALLTKNRKSNEKSGYFEDDPKTLMRAQLNYLSNGIAFLSNNVSEWMNEDYSDNYDELLEAYINYNCYANPAYCESQRVIEQNLIRINDPNGKLIVGSNWYDERYGMIYGVNYDGLYPKTFQSVDSSFATVGFHCVLRLK